MAQLPLRYLRRRLNEVGLFPNSRLGWSAFFLLSTEILISVVQQSLQHFGMPRSAAALDFWIPLLTFINIILFTILGLRWVRRVLLWRLRNRLMVTYMFIGVTPILLILCMVALSAYLVAGQFAALMARTDWDAQIQALTSANRNVAAAVLANPQGEAGARASAQARLASSFPNASFSAWMNGKRMLELPADNSLGTAPPEWAKQSFAGLVATPDKKYFLRDISIVTQNGSRLVSIASVPLDQVLLQKVAGKNTQIALYGSIFPNGITISGSDKGAEPDHFEYNAGQEQNVDVKPTLVAGSVPAPVDRFDMSSSWPLPMPVVQWTSGKEDSEMLNALVSTRWSVLYNRLFSTYSKLGEGIKYVLLALAIVFGIIEFVALLIGLGLTRTITGSVAALYRATEHINRADFRHRIAVKSHDQLAALETSFNSMTESLERLIAEQKEKQRLESELAIAQEVQAQLFPRQDLRLPSLELHGVCLPARTVSGDYYDFLPLGDDQMAIAVGDISGKGISAALLMATIHSAVRVYEFGGMPQSSQLVAAGSAALVGARAAAGLAVEAPLPGIGLHSPADVLWLLNRHIFHSTPAEKYATMFLGIYDGARRQLLYCNAGHLPPFVISASGEVRKLLDGGLVIGLFENVSYHDLSVPFERGDLFVAYSDGVTEPENEFGEFGEGRLIELLQENRNLPLAQLSQTVTSSVKQWMGGGEQPDDLTLVLARAQ